MSRAPIFFLALAADYDGTIAEHGVVDEPTRKALRSLRQTGRRLVLVTGRELAELEHAFPEMSLFHLVVAENGAVLHEPSSGETTVLASPPPPRLIEKLMTRNVQPLSVGHCVVATWEPHQAAVLEAIHELGLDLQIVFNKGAIMVLPAGITKASGLAAALARLDISRHNVVGVGDAENDHALLQACGCAAAVANAIPTIKAAADVVLTADHGAGVSQLIQRIVDDDSRLVLPSRLGLNIGVDHQRNTVYLLPHEHVLVMGDSGCGKSRFAKMLTERMVEKRFEFCVMDPEGDYHDLRDSVAIAQGATVPRIDEAIRLLRETGVNVVVNAVALGMPERRRLVAELLGPISELKVRTGRPHWIIADEAHQIFPASLTESSNLPTAFSACVFITVCPENLSADILRRINVAIAFGKAGVDKLASLQDTLGCTASVRETDLQGDEVLIWFRRSAQAVHAVQLRSPRQIHHRHLGKYAVGDVGDWHSFYFRGRDNSGTLRARNVWEFAHLSQKLDDATWEHHLRAHDYSTWFRDVIKDQEIASQMKKIEEDTEMKPGESRAAISRMLLSRYTEPFR